MTKHLCIAVVAALATSCGSMFGADNQVEYPPLRASPSRLLRVSGSTDAAVTVELDVQYHTTAKTCEVTTNVLAGAKSARFYRHPLKLSQGAGHYTAAVPLDIVEPGDCGWAPFSVNYVVRVDGTAHNRPIAPTALVWFRQDEQTSLAELTVTCGSFRDALGAGIECRPPAGNYFISPQVDAMKVHFRTSRPSG